MRKAMNLGVLGFMSERAKEQNRVFHGTFHLLDHNNNHASLVSSINLIISSHRL